MDKGERKFDIKCETNDLESVHNNHDCNDIAEFHGPSYSQDPRHQASASLLPRIYSQLIGMYTNVRPPSIPCLRVSSFTASVNKKSPLSNKRSTFFDPLISSPTSSDEDEYVEKQPSSWGLRASINQLPSPNGQCSYIQSVLNAVNVLCGIGILSMPYALKEGGWLSILLLFLFGVISCYTGIIIKKCLDSSYQLQTYPDIGQAAFGMIGRICTSAILYADLYSACVEFLILLSDNLSVAFPNLQFNAAGIHLNSYQICAIISTLVILPTVWLRSLSLLSYVSVGGVGTLILVVLCLVWAGMGSHVEFHPDGKVLDVTNLPIAVGIFSFCYGGHSVFPNIYSSMKEPTRFPSVLIVSFLVSGLLYTSVAILGFLMFGEGTKSQYTLNIPRNMIVSKIARWAMVVAPVTKFGLTMTPVALTVEDSLSGRHKSRAMSILIRTCLTFSTFIVALILPYFTSVMALIGSLLVMLISVILPCGCYMRINKGILTTREIVICSTVLVVGVLCAILGTYSSVTSIAGKQNII